MPRRRRSPPTPRMVRIVTVHMLLSARRRRMVRALRVVVLLLACAGAGLVVGLMFGPKPAGGAGGGSKRRLDPTTRLQGALSVIEANHVDNPNLDNLLDAAINGALTALDRHSQFFDSTSYRRWRARIHGQKISPGFDIHQVGARFFIVEVVAGSPAAALGMVAGDEILALDGSALDGLALGVVKKMLEGDEGTTLLIRWRHRPLDDLAHPPGEVTLIRTKRATVAVHATPLQGGLLHVRVERFQEGVAKDVLTQCRRFESSGQKLQGLVLDLRGNLGGLLNEAVLMADLFLPPDQVIVSLEGRQGKVLKVHASAAEQMLPYPLVILIDRRSASASEIVASALQDHRRALIVGQVSYGKGSVQSTYPLKDGSGLKITTSRYYSPLHRQIDELGVHPDVLVPDAASPDTSPRLPASADDPNPVDPQDIPLQMAVGLLRSSRVLSAGLPQ